MRKIIASVAVGCACAAIYLIVAGYLLFQAQTVESGLIFNWNLEPVSVTDPQPPVLQMASFLLWSALVFWLLLWLSARSSAISRSTSLVTTASVLVVVAGIFLATANYPRPSLMDGTDSAFLACLQTGATSPATMTMAAALVVFAFAVPQIRSATQPPIELEEAGTAPASRL